MSLEYKWTVSFFIIDRLLYHIIIDANVQQLSSGTDINNCQRQSNQSTDMKCCWVGQAVGNSRLHFCFDILVSIEPISWITM